MKKLRLLPQRTLSRACHRSINAMLTPFLFVFFLLGFLNVNTAQDCPPAGINCQNFIRSVTVNVAPLWGDLKGTCTGLLTYLERRCDGQVDFEVISESMSFAPSAGCQARYDYYYALVKSQGQEELDKLIAKEETVFSQAALAFSAKLFSDELPSVFICPTKTLTGRYYFGPCGVTCIKKIYENNGVDESIVFQRSKIPCGLNCCHVTQKFCLENGKLVFGDFKYNQVPGTTPCEPSTAQCGKFTIYRSSCMSACEIFESKVEVVKNDIASIDISNATIKATIVNNSTTNTIVVSFLNEFEGKVSLFDLMGKQLFSTSKTKDDDYTMIDTNGLPKGVYVVNLQANNKQIISEKVYIK